MTLRIISGRYKNHILHTPKGTKTRPTQGVVRGAVFNICQNMTMGSSFLDFFAGSGAMGLEALSRGALHATFVENNHQALLSIRQNIDKLGVTSQTTVVPCKAELALRQFSEPFDIVYLDPPYNVSCGRFVEELCEYRLLRVSSILFIEEKKGARVPPTFPFLSLVSSRSFGLTTLHHYMPTS